VQRERDELAVGRWQPVRAGILNVWRYYDEVFHFHRGRLLLRGPNGTGKSKALELLLPYLFDASLRPERLSTFRGTERTMHWNLMGDGYAHASRVGYVWLECGRRTREGVEDWFTCGARLQASASTRSVSATYFTTAQRIGLPGGLSLLKDDHVPLTGADLATALSGSGEVHDAEGYRRAVRETLFRGFTDEQYTALISALLQLRTPKLSEHLDPHSLSELLTRALPPLDSQDVSEIAEGFEKLDRRQEDLGRLDQELGAADQLASRQRAYARRVLRRSAADLISATTQLENVTRHARTTQARYDETAERIARLAAEIEGHERERLELEERITGLRETDAYRHGLQLDKLREQARQAEADAGQARDRAERRAADARADAEAQARLRAAAQEAAGATERAEMAASTHAAQAGLEGVTERMRTSELEGARSLLRTALTSREQQLADVRRAVAAHERAHRDHEFAERRLAAQLQTLEQAEAQLATREREHRQTQEALRTEVAGWATTSVHLALGSRASELADLVSDERALLAVVGAAAAEAREQVARSETELRADHRRVADERVETAAERDRLAAQGVIEPAASAYRSTDRVRLAGGPFWRLVEWRGGVPERVQAGVEAALEAAGLLDAWVLPDGGVESPGHDQYLEAALSVRAPGRSLADVLAVDAASPVPRAHVEALLRGVAVGEAAPQHVAAVGEDGTWRLAHAHGSWTKPAAAYLGASARERARRRRLDELQDELTRLDGELARLDEELARLSRSRDQIREEQARRPSHEPLRRAEDQVRRAESRVGGLRDFVQSSRAERDEAAVAEQASLRDLTLTASRHGLPATAEAIEQLEARLHAYRDSAGVWLDRRAQLERDRDRAATADRQAGRSARLSSDAASEAGDREERAAGLRVQTEAVEGAIGVEYRQVLDEVGRLRECSRAVGRENKERTHEHSRASGSLGELRTALQMVTERREEATQQRDAAAARFRRLAGLSIGRDAALAVDLSELPSTTAARDAATRVADELRTLAFEAAHVNEAGSRLAEAMYQVRHALAGRVDLELETDTECDAQVATATIDGLAVSPGELASRLRAERDATRAQLSEDERQLFDRTLTGDTRRHVAERIRQADALVQSMNAQLDRVQPASGLRVSLRWEVDPDQEAAMKEARRLLLRDSATLSKGERDSLHEFFRARIDEVRQAGTTSGWEEQLMQVLDYRKWHRFVVQARLPGGEAHVVTRRFHGALSGGEKALVLHLPLFAAAAGHYGAAAGAPRLILLDEVFVGVDQTNRGQLFDLVTSLDLDLLLTSDHEWCTYAEVDGIAIHQLITGSDGDDAVTTARFVWDGSRLQAGDGGLDAAPGAT
jgi:uncharacterized protein (TIGR02680 family)